MNYYEHHLGDYARDTGHLTMLEHGAYRLLLDRYYATEEGIPADQAHRVARARDKDERNAVDAVLREFFTLEDGVWTHGRVAQEIDKARRRIEVARSNGKAGGRPRKNQPATEQKPSGFPAGYENETQSKTHHTPHTNHQAPPIDTHTATGTVAGRVCLVMRRAGIPDTNPGHPDLLALIEAGATDAEFAGAAATAADRSKGFAYALGTLKRQRAEAKSTAQAIHHGAMPSKAPSAAELRVLQATPDIAAPHLRPNEAPQPLEVIDAIPGTAVTVG